MKTKWEGFLSQEISIKYKTGIYSLCHLFYIAIFLIYQQTFQINLVQLAQIVLLAWLMNHMEIYLFGNFDQADRISLKWCLYAFICSFCYMLVAHVMKWFGGNFQILLGFGLYQLLCYWGVYMNNKIKRRIDSKQLNQQLERLKRRKGERP